MSEKVAVNVSLFLAATMEAEVDDLGNLQMRFVTPTTEANSVFLATVPGGSGEAVKNDEIRRHVAVLGYRLLLSERLEQLTKAMSKEGEVTEAQELPPGTAKA